MLALRSPVHPSDGGLLLLAAARRPIETKLAVFHRLTLDDERGARGQQRDFLVSALAEISRTIMSHRAVSLEGARVQLEAMIEWNGSDEYTMAGCRSVLSVVERELSRQGRA